MDVLFDSDRLLFREFTTGDARLIYELNKDPEVTQYVHEPAITEQLASDVLNEVILPQYRQNGFGRWAVHLKDNLTFIGWCGLKRIPEAEHPDLGYRFLKKYWGCGYASEAAKRTIEYAFMVLELPGIFASAHIENLASNKILLKCGMKFTGIETMHEETANTYLLLNHS